MSIEIKIKILVWRINNKIVGVLIVCANIFVTCLDLKIIIIYLCVILFNIDDIKMSGRDRDKFRSHPWGYVNSQEKKTGWRK